MQFFTYRKHHNGPEQADGILVYPFEQCYREFFIWNIHFWVKTKQGVDEVLWPKTFKPKFMIEIHISLENKIKSNHLNGMGSTSIYCCLT